MLTELPFHRAVKQGIPEQLEGQSLDNYSIRDTSRDSDLPPL